MMIRSESFSSMGEGYGGGKCPSMRALVTLSSAGGFCLSGAEEGAADEAAAPDKTEERQPASPVGPRRAASDPSGPSLEVSLDLYGAEQIKLY